MKTLKFLLCSLILMISMISSPPTHAAKLPSSPELIFKPVTSINTSFSNTNFGRTDIYININSDRYIITIAVTGVTHLSTAKDQSFKIHISEFEKPFSYRPFIYWKTVSVRFKSKAAPPCVTGYAYRDKSPPNKASNLKAPAWS